MSVPFIPRQVTQPPGKLNKQTILSADQSRIAVNESRLSPGAKKLLTGLLRYGGVMDFPKGRGLDYAYLLKDVFRPEYLLPSLQEFAQKLKGQADVIIGPQQSAIAPAAILASLLNVPFIRVVKNLKSSVPVYSVAIESYTSGAVDNLGIPKQALVEAAKVGGRIFKLDDIVDTGGISLTVQNIISQAQKEGIKVKLVGVGALFEKSYTGASKIIKQKLGFESVSCVVIDDLGFDPQGHGWIRVKGIDKILRFY